MGDRGYTMWLPSRERRQRAFRVAVDCDYNFVARDGRPEDIRRIGKEQLASHPKVEMRDGARRTGLSPPLEG